MGNPLFLEYYDLPIKSKFLASRFQRPDLNIELEPSFKISLYDRVFVMGSCFAREIAHALQKKNFCVTDAHLGNHYSIFSTYQAINWAIKQMNREWQFDERYVLPLLNGQYFSGYYAPLNPHDILKNIDDNSVHMYGSSWHIPLEKDPQLSGSKRFFYATSQEAIQIYSEALDRVARAITQCDVFVLTLGLLETWYDHQTETYLNVTPPNNLIANFDQRFSVNQMPHQMNLKTIIQLLRLIYSVNPNVRIVCTVSPVPMSATFFGADCLISNCYSKSTLRSALDEAIRYMRKEGFQNLDYFPSYELVIYTGMSREQVWRQRTLGSSALDQRHIEKTFIEEVIIPFFEKHYLAQSGVSCGMLT